MNKIDQSDFLVASESAESRGRAPNGAGVVLAVATGTLCWVGIFLLFI